MTHGTTTGYKHGCRCEHCRAASAAAKRRYRAGEGPGRTPSGIQTHGLHGYLRHRCRCEVCRAANAAAMSRYRARIRGQSAL